MRLGKLLTAVAAAAMVSVLFVMPVSAHHGHHRQAAAGTGCPVCTVEGCTEEDATFMTASIIADMTMRTGIVTVPASPCQPRLIPDTDAAEDITVITEIQNELPSRRPCRREG